MAIDSLENQSPGEPHKGAETPIALHCAPPDTALKVDWRSQQAAFGDGNQASRLIKSSLHSA
jgi:hypothetical protein